MKFTDILQLIGGLSLFLYGMKMMSEGLEATSGNKLKQLLEKLTTNPILGVLVGAGITAVIQSSSATTVMVVGFVNSGIMQLAQAVWVIMGANIGTTITGQLIALDIGVIAPIFALVGVVLCVFVKSKKLNHIGEIIAGLGVLFIGMGLMGDAMNPLRSYPPFINLMTRFSNPLIGILAGMLFTAVIQSSSASIGILQTLANAGLIPLSSSVFVLFGQNIGTCITAVLAAIGTNRNAKRTTIIHLLFNVIGTFIFVAICLLTPFTNLVASFTPTNPSAQIANMHTIFNIVTTLLLLPFGYKLAEISRKLLPDTEEEVGEMRLKFIDQRFLLKEHSIGSSAIAITQIQQELARMYAMARENVILSFEAVEKPTDFSLEKIEETEEYIDYLNNEISKYISHVVAFDMPAKDGEIVSSLFRITGNIERIGDHAMNIAGYAKMFADKGLSFSQYAQDEVEAMKAVSLDALDIIYHNNFTETQAALAAIEIAEAKIDEMNYTYRQNQLERLKMGACTSEACVIYSEMLTDFERIGDHMLNIAQEYAKIE